ncbi:type VI secretion system-associated FHA domain protein TagH [Scandinavium manionii]|uniref:type VI secretion system-associated FHA domain protein TagH n=1 Tax=Scandinavium manionii TaxID=2926520 RepID=UPI0021655A6B|nr:type VI secretion system-associated FHA domain protein TagH [Scandinavium manionii]MCS2164497.1 type VI secretion system-associated FHA domain protein TagH [Scandinavium manionii]
MRFTIISAKADHQPPQCSCDFYAPGGTIGRGTDNNLVLPDNDRAISRLQVIVHIAESGECRITNRGNVTQVVLNDIPLERGRQVELQDGDILSIDEYRIEVSYLIQDEPQINGIAASMQSSGREQQIPLAKVAEQVEEEVPEKGPAKITAVPSEIWDNLLQEFSISDSISSHREAPQTIEVSDPFNEPKAQERNPEDPLAIFNRSELLFARQGVQTDELFSEDTPFSTDNIFADATPTALLLQTESPTDPVKAESEEELDPLALFGSRSLVKAARNDDPLGLMGGAPLTSVDALTASEELPAEKSPVKSDTTSASPLFKAPQPSLDEHKTVDIHGIEDTFKRHVSQQEKRDLAGVRLPTPQAVVRQPTQSSKGRLRIDPVKSAAFTTATQKQPASGSGEVLQGELFDALLDGMGLNDMQSAPQFDRENMYQLGQMLSMFSQGTVALLSSRSILKRGVKADMTMVLDDANNPFKLLPSGKTVLMQMFGTRMPGFMPPKKSVRDALIDLQAHQLGMISGIRAIIAAILQSFNPAHLEEEAKRNGSTSRLSLPANRKAALWEHFIRTYGETAGEIEDDFHTLFGEAFLYAYDMEVNQYKDSQSGSEE